MISFRFEHVRVESFGLHFPSTLLSSAEIEERIGAVYQRLQIPTGTLERVSGVSTRGMWATDVTPSSVATIAAREALDRSGFRPDQIGRAHQLLRIAGFLRAGYRLPRAQQPRHPRRVAGARHHQCLHRI